MSISRCFALFVVFSSIGCVAFQDTEYCAAQKCRAHRAWWCDCELQCSSNPFSHYSRGWRKGYSDVLMGGDGETPPVPPQCYWSHKYQTEAGECAINDWFLGYQHGAATAIAACAASQHFVPVSDEFRKCSPGCIGTDHAVYPFGRTNLGPSMGVQPSNQQSANSIPPLAPAAPLSPDVNLKGVSPEQPGAKAPEKPDTIRVDPETPMDPDNREPAPPPPAERTSTSDPIVPPSPESASSDAASDNSIVRAKWMTLSSITTQPTRKFVERFSRRSTQD